MHCWIYVSSQSKILDQEELNIMVSKASEFNNSLGVTGFLSLFERKYFQFIEGSEDAIVQLQQKITGDDRHRILESFAFELPHRLCPKWNMIRISPEMENSVHFAHLAEKILDMKATGVFADENLIRMTQSLVTRWTFTHRERSTRS